MHHGAAWGVVHALYNTVVVLRQFLHELTDFIRQSAQRKRDSPPNSQTLVPGIHWSLVPAGPWYPMFPGPCWSLVSTGPWSLLVPGIQWSLVPAGPWYPMVPGPGWSLVLVPGILPGTGIYLSAHNLKTPEVQYRKIPKSIGKIPGTYGKQCIR